MFDVAFSELVIIAIVALIVIGPEKLPKVARTLGSVVGRLQRYMTNVKADIERELQFEDLQKLQQEIKQGVEQTRTALTDEAGEIEHSIGGAWEVNKTEAKQPNASSDSLGQDLDKPVIQNLPKQ